MLTTFTAPTATTAAQLPSALRAWVGARLGRPGAQPAPSPVTHELRRSATFALAHPQGQRVECLAGCLWITLDRDARDFIVEAGESFVADRDQRALVHALEASQVRVVPTAA